MTISQIAGTRPTGDRSRARYVALALLTIAVGLLVHLWGAGLGPVARDILGDALWAAMIAWFVATLLPRAHWIARMWFAYAWCAITEFSQLYHAPALDAVRATRLGHLVLGNGFDPRDLAAYAIGVAGAALVERMWLDRRGARPLKEKQDVDRVMG